MKISKRDYPNVEFHVGYAFTMANWNESYEWELEDYHIELVFRGINTVKEMSYDFYEAMQHFQLYDYDIPNLLAFLDKYQDR